MKEEPPTFYAGECQAISSLPKRRCLADVFERCAHPQQRSGGSADEGSYAEIGY